jgi:hypothetical protein
MSPFSHARPSLAECLASNLETHVECVPRPRHWGGFRATKPAEMPLFYSGANKMSSQRHTRLVRYLKSSQKRQVRSSGPDRRKRTRWPGSWFASDEPGAVAKGIAKGRGVDPPTLARWERGEIRAGGGVQVTNCRADHSDRMRSSKITREPVTFTGSASRMPSWVSFRSIPSACSIPRNHPLNVTPLLGALKWDFTHGG